MSATPRPDDERPSAVGDLVKSCPHAPPNAACRACIALWLTYQAQENGEGPEAFDALLAVAKAAEPFDRTDTRIWTDNDFFQYHETLSLRLAELDTAHPSWREWTP